MKTRLPASARRPTPHRLAALALATLAFAAAPLLAQDGTKKPPAPPPEQGGFTSGPVLVVERAAVEQVLSDPKDRRVAEAIKMIPDRLAELPRDIPDFPPEAAPLISALVRAATHPVRLIVSYDETPTGGFFGYGIALSTLTSGKDEADAIHSRLHDALAQAGNIPQAKPSTRFTGMQDMQLPVGVVSFGPRQAKDGWRYEFIFGTMTDPDAGTETLPKPARGVQPFLRARFDLAGLTPLVNLAQMFAGSNPQVTEVRKQFQDMGLVGARALKVNFQLGHSESEIVGLAAVEGAARVADTLGLPRTALERSDLAAVPSDAVYASVSRSGSQWAGQALSQAREKNPDFDEGYQQFKQMTGVDPQADILDSLGDLSAFYMSDATGGGGLGSATLMVSVKNREKLIGAFTRLAGVVNDAAKEHAKGYVRVGISPGREGVSVFSLETPGIPVPLELTMAVTDRWLILSPTPQGAMVAADQARGKGDGGLPSNPAFAAMAPKEPVTSIAFSDTARSLPLGYTFASMLGSALANGVRSPSAPERNPGVLIPTYPELKRGIKASVVYSYWRGEDYLMEMHGDHSMVVNGTAMIGSVSRVLPAIAIAAAAISGGVERARETARHAAPPPAKRRPKPKPEGDALLDLPGFRASSGATALVELYRQSLPLISPERLALEAADSGVTLLGEAGPSEPKVP